MTPIGLPEAFVAAQQSLQIMALTTDDILLHPALARSVRCQAQTLLAMHDATPRVSSVFATQQRWLMGHAALALYFRSRAADPRAGLLTERFLETVEEHAIASRNTAAAFIKEMLQYDIVRALGNGALGSGTLAGRTGRRGSALEPAPSALMALFGWHVLHLATLDRLDGGQRVARFNAHPTWLAEIQPLIADGLINTHAVREPGATFALFTWVNEGGVVMDRLIAGCEEGCEQPRIPTDVRSVSELAHGLRLSRTQLGRKFVEAEAMGSLGWTGGRGKSRLWVSADFRREYLAAQAVKLGIIEAAFEACVQRAQQTVDDEAVPA